MRIQAGVLLAAFAFALPAQTEPQPAKPTEPKEKLWKVEAAGISGWGAASVAKRVRDTLAKLEKNKDIANLVFDTTGIGYFEAGKKVPEIAELNAMLAKEPACKGVTIRSLTEVELPKAECVYELTVSGLGWMSTAVETRDVLSRMEGVIRVHPNGLNGKATVHVKDKEAFTEAAAKAALAGTKELRLRKFEVAKG